MRKIIFLINIALCFVAFTLSELEGLESNNNLGTSSFNGFEVTRYKRGKKEKAKKDESEETPKEKEKKQKALKKQLAEQEALENEAKKKEESIKELEEQKRGGKKRLTRKNGKEVEQPADEKDEQEESEEEEEGKRRKAKGKKGKKSKKNTVPTPEVPTPTLPENGGDVERAGNEDETKEDFHSAKQGGAKKDKERREKKKVEQEKSKTAYQEKIAKEKENKVAEGNQITELQKKWEDMGRKLGNAKEQNRNAKRNRNTILKMVDGIPLNVYELMYQLEGLKYKLEVEKKNGGGATIGGTEQDIKVKEAEIEKEQMEEKWNAKKKNVKIPDGTTLKELTLKKDLSVLKFNFEVAKKNGEEIGVIERDIVKKETEINEEKAAQKQKASDDDVQQEAG